MRDKWQNHVTEIQWQNHAKVTSTDDQLLTCTNDPLLTCTDDPWTPQKPCSIHSPREIWLVSSATSATGPSFCPDIAMNHALKTFTSTKIPTKKAGKPWSKRTRMHTRTVHAKDPPASQTYRDVSKTFKNHRWSSLHIEESATFSYVFILSGDERLLTVGPEAATVFSVFKGFFPVSWKDNLL